MKKILLLENPHVDADPIFANAGVEVTRINGSLDEQDLIEAMNGFDMIGIRSKTNLTAKVLDAHPNLDAIGAFCIGTNQIDLKHAADLGITVFNAPYSNTRSVVELVIAEIVDLYRRISVHNSQAHHHNWDKTAAGSHEVRGRTLGIIGYGNIGTQLSVLAEAFGMNVVFYDLTKKLALGNAVQMPTMEAVLRESDVITLHVDGRDANHNMFGEEQFNQMKQGAMFINLSRGFLVDIDALRRHLESGHLAGAAVDVYPQEPKKNGEPFESALIGLDNVILTPHIGGSTLEAQYDIGQFVAGKLCDFLATGGTEMSVNMPNLNLPVSQGSRYRVRLIHRNMPGVMAQVNQVFAQIGANVDSQILSTQGTIGYLVTDISSELPENSLAQIRESENTIRLTVTPL